MIFKAMNNLGSSVIELRKRLPNGVFRVVYVAKFEWAIFILHCFKKKTQQTSRKDIEMIKHRYSALIQELQND